MLNKTQDNYQPPAVIALRLKCRIAKQADLDAYEFEQGDVLIYEYLQKRSEAVITDEEDARASPLGFTGYYASSAAFKVTKRTFTDPILVYRVTFVK